MLAQEVVKIYHKGGGKPQCPIRVDIMKAYDLVSWEFVLQCFL
jgi:hypothetical protein